MSNNLKIILSAFILAGVVSLLFLVVPVTATFVIAYMFTLVAIASIALSLIMFGKGNAKAPQGYAFTYTAVTYAVIGGIFSIIACVAEFSAVWTFVIHTTILAIFAIRTIALTAGSKYINKLDDIAEEKHKNFEKEKESYWN